MSDAGRATKKAFKRGTHRTVSPAETFERFAKNAAQMGITRLANVTGLDYLGIPVCVAVRPNARSLSVCQGKGLDCWSATVSALMEAAEFFCAEQIVTPMKTRSYSSLKSEAAVVDPRLLPRMKTINWSTKLEIAWIMGRNLADSAKIWVPFELVHTNHTLPKEGTSAAFWRSSDGLGAGNHWLEAICAGIYEAIERDATALWTLRDQHEQARRRIDLETIRNADCRALLGRCACNDIAVTVWDMTTDIGVACFMCRMTETAANERSSLGPCWGAGCHLDRNVALVRAITEAAQSRLTYIVGVRDDLELSDYHEVDPPKFFNEIVDLWQQQWLVRSFTDIPTVNSGTFESDVQILLSKLSDGGLSQIVAVDLTDRRLGIPVVKIIVPGLEAYDHQGRLRQGRRARAFE